MPNPRFTECGSAASVSSPVGTTRMSAPVISYEPFERFIVSLCAEGFAKDADRLHYLIHKVAWTTGSELVGELGQEIIKLRRENGVSFLQHAIPDGGGLSNGVTGVAKVPAMNRKANKVPAPNCRPGFPLGASGEFDPLVCPQPAATTAAGEARRSMERR